MMKVCSGIFMLFFLFSSSVWAAVDGAQVYQKTCFVCHASGVAGAPKYGNKEDWSKHNKPLAELYKSAIHGYGAMPPKGGNMSLTDEEVKAAVDYMIHSSGLTAIK